MSEHAPVPILRAEELEKTYRMGSARIEVLRGVSLEVYPGEILAIAGPSGAGKSTLLHLLGLLEEPDAGRVIVGGLDASKTPTNRPRQGPARRRKRHIDGMPAMIAVTGSPGAT